MSRGFGLSWKTALLILACCLPARSQETQFLPEIDAHLELNSSVRVYVEAKDDRDGGDPTQFTIGPSIQFYLKPLVKLKRVKTFDLDDSKSRALVLEAGYRYITAPGAPTEERMVLAATSHFPIAAGFRLSDRSRADLDWKSGIFKWRYRNKLTVERTFRDPLLSPDPVCRCRAFLRKPVRASGVPPLSMPVACSQWADTSNSTPTMSTTTTLASTRTSK